MGIVVVVVVGMSECLAVCILAVGMAVITHVDSSAVVVMMKFC